MPQPELNLNGFTFSELFSASGIERLDQQFFDMLCNETPHLYHQLKAYRDGAEMTPKQISDLLINSAPYLESAIAQLFNIENEVAQSQARTLNHDPIFAFKKYYVLRCARRAANTSGPLDFPRLDQWLSKQLPSSVEDRELQVAEYGIKLLEQSELNQAEIDRLIEWCVAALTTAQGQQAVEGWMSFRLPQKLDYANLVSVEPTTTDHQRLLQGDPQKWRERDGFSLTDQRMTAREAQNEVEYCVYCHENDGDFCSKGFPVKKGKPELGLKLNPLVELLTGCPLEEKISEMHVLKKSGFTIAALAVIMVDNPMCPMTGHRICNDCMKACIYQKQQPVNIPQTETRILTDVLELPWGVEIYDLLVRWNPLRRHQFKIKPYNGLKIMVMGMGPAGFTLAHHLLMEGFAVVGVDGLKLEPLPEKYINQPIYRYQDLCEPLNDRIMAGFGGVAEYGITVRWDKNFLRLIYINLMRRPYFQIFGSVRFGAIRVEDVWQLGFHHLAVAVGAGLPRELSIENSLAPGMRQANDFLMSLQLTGAAKSSSLANLQVRLPAVIIGGGLTGIDTATEVQAYYILQVEKILQRYTILVNHFGEETIRSRFISSDLIILDEFLMHGKAVAAERELAKQQQRAPQFIYLIRQWGGVTVAYRRSMQESPAYRRNHEEVIKAFEEGIYYGEGLEPESVKIDEFGDVCALSCRWRIMNEMGEWMFTDELQILPARSIFVATGAKPNIAYEFEHRGTFNRIGFEYRRYENHHHQMEEIISRNHVKAPPFGPFTSYYRNDHRVSFLGDTHPTFHGSVVKAIASAQQFYPKIVELFNEEKITGNDKEYKIFREKIADLMSARIIEIKRHNSKVVELTVRAPLIAKLFQPGQFCRIQNYECKAVRAGDTSLQMEALALIGIPHAKNDDILSFIIVERGVSSRLIATLNDGDPISLMGPTGAKIKIPEQPQTIILIGGAFALAHLFSVGDAYRRMGHKIILFAWIEHEHEIFCLDRIQSLTDQIIWISPIAASIQHMIGGNQKIYTDFSVAAQTEFRLMDEEKRKTIKRIHINGTTEQMRMIQQARSEMIDPWLNEETQYFAAVFGPMQCMMKGVCAQCLQWQIDPVTGQRTKAVYSCSWQNQPFEIIDIDNMDERAIQNRCQETLSQIWLDYLFETEEIARI